MDKNERHRLESLLYGTRRTVKTLAAHGLPDELRKALAGEPDWDGWDAWEKDVTEQVILATEPDQFRRAVCPLCRRGDDFSYPLGLERHLTGWGRANRCAVMEAAREMAMQDTAWSREAEASTPPPPPPAPPAPRRDYLTPRPPRVRRRKPAP